MTAYLSPEQQVARLIAGWRLVLINHCADDMGKCWICKVPLNECTERRSAFTSLRAHNAVDGHGNPLPAGAPRPAPQDSRAVADEVTGGTTS